MELNEIKTLLEALSSVGIEEAVLDPLPEGTRIRGANKELSVIVYHDIPEKLVDEQMGIQSVKGLLSRIYLFDVTKATLTVEYEDKRAVDILIKQGRRKASYKCAEPTTLSVPKKVPGDLSITTAIEFKKDYVDQLSQAFTAMSYTGSKAQRTVSIGVKNNVAELAIFDGEDDTFTDEFDLDFPDTKKVMWDVVPFQRVLKQSVEANTDHAVFTITEYGVAVFSLDFINVLVAPFAR